MEKIYSLRKLTDPIIRDTREFMYEIVRDLRVPDVTGTLKVAEREYPINLSQPAGSRVFILRREDWNVATQLLDDLNAGRKSS